jgi:hypothetical protein
MKTLPTALGSSFVEPAPQVSQMRHQASRRALLMGFAAAATPMAPTLANSLSEPAPAVVDPIFDLIERHKAVCNAARAIGDAAVDTDPDGPARERFQEAIQGERKVLVALLTCEPTTLAGCAAVLEHVGRQDWVFGDDSDQTVLIDAYESDVEEAQMFPKHLASALRNIVERGQA